MTGYLPKYAQDVKVGDYLVNLGTVVSNTPTSDTSFFTDITVEVSDWVNGSQIDTMVTRRFHMVDELVVGVGR